MSCFAWFACFSLPSCGYKRSSSGRGAEERAARMVTMQEGIGLSEEPGTRIPLKRSLYFKQGLMNAPSLAGAASWGVHSPVCWCVSCRSWAREQLSFVLGVSMALLWRLRAHATSNNKSVLASACSLPLSNDGLRSCSCEQRQKSQHEEG